MKSKTLIVNGIARDIIAAEETTLADILRKNLSLTGTKVGCNTGHCGACSVIVDGKLTRSCSYKFKRLKQYTSITTIEGVGTPDNLHPLQLAWILHGGAQCGFCTPGFIVSAKALLDTNSSPTREDVRDWFQKHRNACRCTGYKQLTDAVMDAASVLRGEKDIKTLSWELPEDQRIWGTRYPKPSAVARVTGLTDFGADKILKMPEDTLHMALVQAEVSHAEIVSIDTSKRRVCPVWSRL